MSVAAADSARRGSRSDPEAFFERVLAAFDEAVRLAGGSLERTFRVGPGVLKLLFAGEELADSVAPPFEPLEVMRDAPAAWRLTISLFHGANGRVRLPRAPWSAGDYDGRGEITGFNDARWQTILDPARGGLRMLDRQMSRGAYFVPSAAEVPSQGWTMPLCSLIGGWVRDLPLQLIHAGAVGTARGGVLITGKGGSGKSTTAAACLGSGLGLAGDDLVLVDMAGDLVVHSLLSTVKLEPSALARLPYLAPLVEGTERVDGEKHVLWISRGGPGWHLPHFTLRAVLAPRVTGGRDSGLVPASPAEVLRRMVPTTLFLLPGTGAEAFRKMADLVRRVPCFVLECGTDLLQIPHLIHGLVDCT